MTRHEGTLEDALELYNKGKLSEAEILSRQLLGVTPENPIVLHLLGLIAVQHGQFQKALELIGHALKVDSGNATALMNYGNVLGALDNPEKALMSYDSALVIDPKNVIAWNSRGAALHRLGRYDEAIESYRRALQIAPSETMVLNNIGLSLQSAERFSEALSYYDKSLADEPGNADTLVNRATVLKLLGHREDAIETLDRLAVVSGNNVGLWLQRALLLKDLGNFEDALHSCDTALAIAPDHPETFNARGMILSASGNFAEAIRCYDRALAIRPDFSEAIFHRGNAMLGCGLLDEALNSFQKAIEANPEYAQAYYNKGFCLLTKGQFREGLLLYEWRKKLPKPIENQTFSQPLWTGKQDIAGKVLFLYSIEQGLGDTIQFYRYALMARNRGAHVILAVQDVLVQLLRDAGGNIEVIDSQAPPKHFDFHAPLMSLPLAFTTDTDTIPAAATYLHARPEKIEEWARRIGKREFKVGINWQGNKDGAADVGRSFSLLFFKGISKIAKVRLISLQKNFGSEQLENLASDIIVETLGAEFDAGSHAFIDTAAVLANLDLVITSDTAMAHLAGALGTPAWVALRFLPDWRWLLDRTDSPWYPSLRLFRQKHIGDWTGVFADMQSELESVVEQRRDNSTTEAIA
jgi:tetratricopeptide (TPR) repeat protein